jgi:hypothetical protein
VLERLEESGPARALLWLSHPCRLSTAEHRTFLRSGPDVKLGPREHRQSRRLLNKDLLRKQNDFFQADYLNSLGRLEVLFSLHAQLIQLHA